MQSKRILIAVLVLIVLGFFAYSNRDLLIGQFFRPTGTNLTDGEINTEALPPEVVADELEIPWELVFLPTGEMLITERPGRLILIDDEKRAIEVQGVAHRGEGGLLGLALHPDFAENNQIYLYLTTETLGTLINRVERYTLRGNTLSNRTIIIDNIPGANYHDGGRIAFGPPSACAVRRADCLLYITTGDAGDEPSAQDTESLAGKILRINADGSIPIDNPFGNAVYSYGHRNSQGIAWDEEGNLWATEHGRSGARSGFDELNKIVKGDNYGWPEFEGDALSAGIMGPEIHSGADETWAPAGATYLNNHIIFTGLRGSSLYVADVSSGSATNLRIYFRGEYGRLRAVTLGPDGMLYVLTNNRDGRGRPEVRDDKIVKIDPKMLGI